MSAPVDVLQFPSDLLLSYVVLSMSVTWKVLNCGMCVTSISFFYWEHFMYLLLWGVLPGRLWGVLPVGPPSAQLGT